MLRRSLVATLGLALALGAGPLSAQLPRPLIPLPGEGNRVTPFFDGWYENADGTITFSFGYSNLNKETVEIPLGADNGPGHLGPAPGVRAAVRPAAGAQGRGFGQGPGDDAGRELFRHHDGPARRGGRHGLRRRPHHRAHHPAGPGIRQDPRGRQDRLLRVPDADAGPGARLRRLRREPGAERRPARGHRPRLGRNGRPVRRGAARGDALLLHRRLWLRRGRGQGPAGHRAGEGPPPGAPGGRAHPVRRRRGRRHRRVQDAGLLRGRPGDRVHLPGPEHRQQHVQGGAAVLRGGRRRAGAAGPAQAGQRPLPGLHGGGHREHGGDHRHPGPDRGHSRINSPVHAKA